MAVMGLHPLYSVDFGQLEMRHQAVMAGALDMERTPVGLDADFLVVRSAGGLKRQSGGATFPA